MDGSPKGPTPFDLRVGQQIRLARLSIGMSQEALGAALGITFQQVQKYEKGTNRVSAGRLLEVSRIVGQPVAWFYGDQAAPAGSAPFIADDLTVKVAALTDPVRRKALCRIVDALGVIP